MQVTLRQRQKGNKISLYLDYYHQGRRKYEYLQLYLVPEPQTGRLPKTVRDENKKILELAESIRSKRHLELKNGIFGFQDQSKMKSSFLRYFEYLTEKRKDSSGNYGNWDSTLKHLKKFVTFEVTFAQINKRWLEDFKEYLQKEALTPAKQNLSQNSASSYYNKVRAALREAYKEGIIQQNPADSTDGIKPGEPEREFLTLEELQALVKVDCEIPILKKAFLFSAMTGLRFSDVEKLTWSEVQHSNEIGNYIRFVQKKTKGAETLPISEQAADFLGTRGKATDRVFVGLKYSAWHNLRLQQWVMKAGITKSITFHCARHTYATLQLTLGTDIYTVSKLLGHKDIKTTQIYAKVIDEKKKEAANRIKLDL
ncbi:MAG: site-specific integrase [Bacteroidales bacterium]|jgi:integrase|nr:site-specific integrase [Bacteroidales bacterium]